MRDAANPKFVLVRGLTRSPLPAMLLVVTEGAQDLQIFGPLVAETGVGVGQVVNLQQIGIILVASLAHAIGALKRSLVLALPLLRREVAKIGLSVRGLARFARWEVEIGKELRQGGHRISIT